MRETSPRTQTRAGALTLAGLVLTTLAAFHAEDLPLLGGGTGYTAEFAEAAGLRGGNEVRVAGVKVGRVTSVSLAGTKVLVGFRLADTRLGDRTTAAIEIKTLLGDKYLSLVPDGVDPQPPRTPIPLARTRTPYELTEVFDQLGNTVSTVDSGKLAASFQVLTDTFRDTPGKTKAALDGLSALSRTIAGRDSQLASLLAGSAQLSGTLAGRDDQVRRLVEDGAVLLGELDRRRAAISALLRGTKELADQLRGLVADNRARLDPVLRRLDQVTGVLQANQDKLGAGLRDLAPYVRLFNNTIGNGRWFDGYFCGLVPPYAKIGVFEINENICTPPLTGGQR
ncbi:phospholipid/cholesterol/gamma-HCH transport system substrate-binding protein [Crossiella equi]|uniref:Phospholipid/cholesterol/gamma-HCH transport system substrate-binding protein n=2 Tax=Crossiella equi TaxID=130796 RepID=A0ABS5A904_9PSEU|nr:MCE family protein [Crossiella equi]MBP2473045.1 phospholipid/cholesterol/gamma-HCH transport system substrate-binding protein [Crossiella equi]